MSSRKVGSTFTGLLINRVQNHKTLVYVTSIDTCVLLPLAFHTIHKFPST